MVTQSEFLFCHWKYLSKRLQSQRCDHSSSGGTDIGCTQLTANTLISAHFHFGNSKHYKCKITLTTASTQILQSLEKRLEMFYNGIKKRESFLLHSYGRIPAPVGVVDYSVEGLVNPLPEDDSRSRPGNTGNRKSKCLPSL